MNLPLTVFMAHFLQRPPSPLRHNEFVRLDIETPVWCGIRVIHRRRARLEDDRPQLGEVLTPIVKIRKTVSAKDGLADPIPSCGQSSAKAGSESGTVAASIIASRRWGNFIRQIPLGRSLDLDQGLSGRFPLSYRSCAR